MKRILAILIFFIFIIIIYLVFWLCFSPQTFTDLLTIYPTVEKVSMKSDVLESQVKYLKSAEISEPVLSSNGMIVINNDTWETEVVKSLSDKDSGLSNRKQLLSKSGMLFAFDEMSNLFFWMKDMLIPIDMIFFDNNWKIVLIESNLQPSSFPKTFGSNVKSQYVLEINALESKKYDLKVGDQAVFLNK